MAALLFACAALSLYAPDAAKGQDVSNYDRTPETIQEIYQNRDAFAGRFVRLPVPVFISSIDVSSQGETRSYTVRDESGTGIEVFTSSEELPEVNGEYVVEGDVEIASSGPYLYETGREKCTWYSPCESGGLQQLLLIGIASLAVVVVGLGIFVANRRREATKPIKDPNGGGNGPTGNGGNGGSLGGDGSTSGGAINTPTVKMNVPQQKTAKFLGQLSVLSSDEDPIPLRAPSDGGEFGGQLYKFTIGRTPPSGPNDFTHIQLKPRTVSRQQAELTYRSGQFYLTNLVSAQKNPTCVNGEPMQQGEQAELSDGDTLQMGEAELRFSSRVV